MKKNIIFAAFAAASALLLVSSCAKEQVNENINTGDGKTFTASIEEGLKTTITGEYKVNWEQGDLIDISGGTTYSATPDASDATRATFTIVSGPDPTPDYIAVYPASIFKNGRHELPATQTYAAGKFNAPMCAISETESLEFKNFCGVLCFALKGTDKVKSIAVTAKEQICGPFEFSTDATFGCFSGENVGYTVTLNCGEGVQLDASTATNFYISLPPATYTAGMKIVITNTEGKTIEKTTTKSAAIARNNIYTFNWTATFAPTIVSVQLWKDGPYWATVNLGEVEDHDPAYPAEYGALYNFADAVAEVAKLGDGWRLPTEEELQALVDNCTKNMETRKDGTGADITGCCFTGATDGYTDKSIFLPSAGTDLDRGDGREYEGSEGCGYYWSSTVLDDTYAAILTFYDDPNVSFQSRNTGLSVRAVRDAAKPVEPEYVEIGGLKWATKNLGAEKVTDYGDYFAWGATELAYSSLSSNTFTFVASRPASYGGSGWTQSSGFAKVNTPYRDGSAYAKYTSSDKKTVLESGDDAATALFRSGWRMPTSAEFQALYDACGGTGTPTAGGSTSTTEKGVYWCDNYDGVKGLLFCDGTNKLFFPAAGLGNGKSLSNAGSLGYYWSSSIYTVYTDSACRLSFGNDNVNLQGGSPRYDGFSVRPVKDVK